MESYVALIIDLKKSRSYSVNDRTAIQNFIITVTHELNQIFRHSITRDVKFSAGDEVQGLFMSPEAAYLYFRLFNMLIFPVEIRAGIGVGEWNIKVENAGATAQDGPAYYNARRAIKETNDAQGYSVLLYSGNENDIFINSAISISFTLTNNHSSYQNELALLAEMLYPINAHNVLDAGKMHLLAKLVSAKNKLNYYTTIKQSKSVKKYPFDATGHINLASSPIDAINDENTFYIIGGKKRGLPTQLANIFGISRQSIEKTFKSANIYAARNFTIVALKLINKYLSGGV